MYIGSTDCYLYAFDSDGALCWRYKTGGKICSSPVIGADGTIYIGSYDGFLYAVDSDGRLQWRFLVGGEVHAAPTLGPDRTLYIGSQSGQLYAIRAALVWETLSGPYDENGR